jgi:hypothetical protein
VVGGFGVSAASEKIPVSDPFDAGADPELPTVARALNPEEIAHEFKRGLPRLAGEDGRIVIKAIRVLRHKPGKRCVIEYDVRVERPGAVREKATLLGKVRARRYGLEGFRLQEAFWKAGFRKRCADNIAVPEPIGVLPKLQMWLQRKVRGVTAGALLAGPDGVALGRRISEAIHKVHRAGVRTAKTHTMADELCILHECLPRVTQLRPELGGRIKRLLVPCDRLGSRVPAPKACGIHRDFYPAQVIVDGARLWLIDFDLYCMGDPGLDVGNFIGHITEQSLRTLGNAAALRDRENALEERFVELTGESVRPAVRAYATLTLARHVCLSTQFPERAAFTEALLELCESRLGSD